MCDHRTRLTHRTQSLSREENPVSNEEPTPSAVPAFDRGPLQTYEIHWVSGHVETVQGHQVSWSGGAMFGHSGPERPTRVMIHGEIDGHFRLVLSALEDDIRTIRNVTAAESIPGGESR